MKKFTRNEGVAVAVSLVMFLLFIGVSVLAVMLFGMLEDTEQDFTDYRSKTEIQLSEFEKEKNSSGRTVEELKNELSLAEKSKTELERKIAQIEEEMAELEAGFNNKDELYSSLNSQLDDMKKLLEEKQTEVASLKKDIEELEQVYRVDLNKQIEILAELETLLTEDAPMNLIETPILNADGTPVIGDDGLPAKDISYVYPQIAIYYEDLGRGYEYSWNGDTVFNSASCVKAPFALSVLMAASEEKAEYDQKIADYLAQNGVDAELPEYELTYDFDKVFTYTEDKYRAGSGVIKDEEFGVQYTHYELFRMLLKYSDNVAFAELRTEYGTTLFKNLAKSLGTKAMKSNLYNATAPDLGKVMKEIYRFTESDAEYAAFMKETMQSSIHTVMIGYGVSPKKIAHKYGWDEDAYHDMAIVYDEHPYVLVVMSDMDAGGTEVNAYIQKVVSLIDDLHENFYK